MIKDAQGEYGEDIHARSAKLLSCFLWLNSANDILWKTYEAKLRECINEFFLSNDMKMRDF